MRYAIGHSNHDSANASCQAISESQLSIFNGIDKLSSSFQTFYQIFDNLETFYRPGLIQACVGLEYCLQCSRTMARTKSIPIRREGSDSWMEKHGSPIQDVINLSNEAGKFQLNGMTQNGSSTAKKSNLDKPQAAKEAGLHELVVCAAGIYASL